MIKKNTAAPDNFIGRCAFQYPQPYQRFQPLFYCGIFMGAIFILSIARPVNV